jgi:hypothetical protein
MCFLFLQEPTNKPDSLAQKKVYAMVKEFKYVTMTCSTSCKLTTKAIFKDLLHPHVITNDFFKKIFSGQQLHQVVEWRVNKHFKDHLCLVIKELKVYFAVSQLMGGIQTNPSL